MQNLVSPLTASVEVQQTIEAVWDAWHNPDDIRQWNVPDNEWTNTRVENDPRTGGTFFFGMKKKDGSDGFDFSGKYSEVIPLTSIAYRTDDGRGSCITFEQKGNRVVITEQFEPDATVPRELQQAFCQGVLEKFRHYVEGKQSV
jgi:uncharacterized protein YndB with AHSA1/START domain